MTRKLNTKKNGTFVFVVPLCTYISMQVSVHHRTPEFPYSQLIVTVEFTTAGDESAQRCEEHTSQQVMYSATANCTPEHVDEWNELH